MLKLLLGRAGTGKTTAILRTIANREERPQVLIVPEGTLLKRLQYPSI